MTKIVTRSDGRTQALGRKLKLTPQLIIDFEKAASEVFYLATAAKLVNVHPVTITKYFKEAEQHEKQSHPELDDCTEFCSEELVAKRTLLNAFKRAQAKFTQDNLKELHKHKKKNWLPAAWLLERTQPNEFGLKSRVEHTGEGGGPIKHSLSIEQRQKVLAAASKSLDVDTAEEEVIEGQIVDEET